MILLTGCPRGRLSRLVETDRWDEARSLLNQYVEWFGPNNVVVEIQHNLVEGAQNRITRLVSVADHLGLPYVATGNVHYHHPDRYRLQDVLVSIKQKTTLDANLRQLRPNPEFYLRSADQMAELFRRWPKALSTTRAIAERCSDFCLADVSYRFPDYPVAACRTPDDVLADVCWRAFRERYPDDTGAAAKRLGEELAVIAGHGLSGFFLVYRDILEMAREVAIEIRGTDSARAASHLPPGRGRGSSVGSVVCYLIGLSHIDPVKVGLMFGRFLHEDRSEVRISTSTFRGRFGPG